MLNPLSWIREAIGLKKDIDEERLRRDAKRGADNLIQRATMDDVKEYDPKVKMLEGRISHRHLNLESLPSQERKRKPVWHLWLLTVASFIIMLIFVFILINHCSGADIDSTPEVIPLDLELDSPR